MTGRRCLALPIIFGLSFFFPAPATMANEPTPSRLESWVVYWDLPHSLEEASRLSSQLSGVGVFCYRFTSDGSLAPASPAVREAISKLNALSGNQRFTIWVSVTNDFIRNQKTILKDASIVHEILTDPGRRSAHIQQLLAIADPVDTLEIDYENLWAKDHDAYSTFISELAQALHARSKHLAVVVQPKTNDLLRDEAGAVDWAAVAGSADFVKVMAYHYHHASGEPGPVAPPDWVAVLTRFALERIPPAKLAVVLTMSGFDWPSGATGKSVDYADAMRLAAARGVRVERDPGSSSPHFSYLENAVRHEVWFEDAQSLTRKMETLQQLGVSHIAFWRLGTGDPTFWAKTTPTK
jgi:spore germination protein YaaH